MLSILEDFEEIDIDMKTLFAFCAPGADEKECVQNEYSVEVLSSGGFHKIEAFSRTEILRLRKITLQDGKNLICADRHRVLTKNGWTFAVDLNIEEDEIYTDAGDFVPVTESLALEAEERLYDIQVADVASFFSNGMLSHNSHMLVAFGVKAMQMGKNVIHYTFELSENQVGLRYDSNFCSIPSNEVPDRKDEVLTQYAGMELGKLIIKYYPTGSATVFTIRSHIEKVMMKKGIKPGLILIDYADVMRSSRQYDSLRHELKLIYEELRNLAFEFDVPIWTASQSNKEGENADFIGLGNMSEAYGKAFVADVVVSLSRKPAEKATGAGRIFVAKNRAGKDGILFNVHVDTACSKFKIIDEAEFSLGEVGRGGNSTPKSQKDLLTRTWRELQKANSTSTPVEEIKQ